MKTITNNSRQNKVLAALTAVAGKAATLLFALLLLMPLGASAATAATDTVKVGDVNGDGKVSVTDAAILISYLNSENPSGFVGKAADVNEDGSINNDDVSALVQLILNTNTYWWYTGQEVPTEESTDTREDMTNAELDSNGFASPGWRKIGSTTQTYKYTLSNPLYHGGGVNITYPDRNYLYFLFPKDLNLGIFDGRGSSVSTYILDTNYPDGITLYGIKYEVYISKKLLMGFGYEIYTK